MQQTLMIGNLTKEPENVEMQNNKLCKLVLAVNENYTNNNGEKVVQFFNVVVWNKLAENCLKYLHKGSKIAVLGRIQNRTWEDEKGMKKYAVEIVATDIEFLSPKKEDSIKLTPVEDKDLPF